MQMRRRINQSTTLEERLALEAIRIREMVKIMPAGTEREALIRKARELEVGAHMEQWLNSPGLQPPG
jgi:hypothetical protein